MKSCIVIIDFGSQYTQLIARRIRELNTYCIIQAYHHQQPQVEDDDTIIGIILSGSPDSAFAQQAPQLPAWVLTLNQQQHIPILGICYGMQVLAIALGGKVSQASVHEFGYAQVRAHSHTQLLQGVQDETNQQGHGLLDVWMSHGDQVTELPQGFQKMASTQTCPFAGMANEHRQIYALQFHPEVTHTKQGKQIIKIFCCRICGSKQDWQMPFITQTIHQQIKHTVGNEKVILGLSGGVDSSVTALLLHQVIPDQLQCVFIDNGLLRLNEAQQVQQTFADNFGINLHTIDASEKFMQSLKGITEPEQKRKVIGKGFIDEFQNFAQTISNCQWLAQGTIYSDVIESAGDQTGKVIKSHHNVGGLPEKMNLKIIEPLRQLFKDEVRQLGKSLGLPNELTNRHPFPGPGLGVRILGEVDSHKANILRQADAIYLEELHQANWYQRVSQAFCVFLPIKSVGVVGDYRRYQWVIGLRAVQTSDFMTAETANLPFDLLQQISNRIVNEISEVSRVVYDISSKPPATIEWE